jgi:hypothetical protein
MSAPVDPAQMAAANGNGGPPNVMVPEDREDVAQALLRGIRAMAENAAMEKSAAEAKDYAAAAKSMADAYVVLDPSLDATGTPLAHLAAENDLERAYKAEQAAQDRAHKTHLEQVRAQQAAPSQKRRKIKISRDAAGRATDYEEEG